MSRTVLVIGATGKQGGGVVRALAAANSAAKPHEPQPYRILALTRSPGKHASLTSLKGVELVQSDLDDASSFENVFANHAEGAIYGVFCCLAFPGLGKAADGELRQGKLAADMAAKYKVSHYIYSSGEQGGDSESGPSPSHVAKMVIEAHVKSLTQKGLRWTILRPSFFYENFDGALGGLSETVLWSSLQKGTKIQMVASEDIGPVVKAIFDNPDEYAASILTVCGDTLTPAEVNAIFKKVTGRPLSRIPLFVGSALYGMNVHAKNLCMHMERVHQLRLQDAGGYNSNSEAARRAHPRMMSFESWILKTGMGRGGKRDKNWNNLTVKELLKGET